MLTLSNGDIHRFSGDGYRGYVYAPGTDTTATLEISVDDGSSYQAVSDATWTGGSAAQVYLHGGHYYRFTSNGNGTLTII